MYLSLSTFLVICLILAAYFLPNWSRSKLSPVQRNYQKALQLLARKGVSRPANMGPRDFSEQVSKQISSDAAAVFVELSDDYIAYQYQSDKSGDKGKAQQLLKRFKSLINKH